MARGQLPHRERPCRSCPWRQDHEPATFGIDRYERLAESCETAGGGHLGAPMFACHLSPTRAEEACAGWLAVEGHGHIGVRLAVATGRLDPAALAPGDGWPVLWASFAEVVAHGAGPRGACGIPAPGPRSG